MWDGEADLARLHALSNLVWRLARFGNGHKTRTPRLNGPPPPLHAELERLATKLLFYTYNAQLFSDIQSVRRGEEPRTIKEEALVDLAPDHAAALQHVIAAVELYLQAVQEAAMPADRKRLRQKCDELMARGERLKAGKPAEPAEPAPIQGTAALVSPMASLLLDSCGGLGAVSVLTDAQDLPAPVSQRELSKKEQIVVLKASRLHGSVFPPWEADPTDNLFSLASPGASIYEDSTPFSMTPQQKAVFTEWKRPADLYEAETQHEGQDATVTETALMQANQDPDLVQDITTDCSVVASLCVLVRHIHRDRRPDRPSLLASIMHPFDHTAAQPRVSASGCYVFRLHFNGAFRKVVIDDRLPASTSRTLFVVDRRNARLLWPALLEKAYLKVHGGYDFPGSNSGTDLWVLTGWVPEQVFLQSGSVGTDADVHAGDLDHVWTAMKQAFDRGDVMVTLGTGRLSAAEETHLGLAGEHDYAVLDLQEHVDSGERRMLVKNPWCVNLVWHGAASPSSPSFTEEEDTTASSPSPRTGTFWISFDDVVQYYESLYLNWNPSLFRHRQDHHFSWTLPTKAMAHSLAGNPQYVFTPNADGPIWILLSRHYQDAELEMVRAKSRPPSALFSLEDRLPDGTESEGRDDTGTGFIALSVYAADGKRVLLADRPRWLHRGPLIDAPQTLLRLDSARRGQAYTVVVAQKGLPLPSYSFTLSFFSSSLASPTTSKLPPLYVAPAPERFAHQLEVAADWSMATAGGSPASPDFVRNPQYALVVPAATPLTLLLCVEADDVPVRVDLVWARGRRVASLAMRDLVVSSGEYQRGCALAAVLPRSTQQDLDQGGGGVGSAGFGPGLVDPGTYTVVVSTFDAGQRTRYTLRVGAAVPVTLQPIPAEDAGKFRTSLEPVLLQQQGGNHDDDHDGSTLRWQAVLEAASSSGTPHVSLVAQAVERRATGAGAYTATAAAAAAASTTAVRVSVERMAGAGGAELLAATGSGQFQNMTVAGLRTGEVGLVRAAAAAASSPYPFDQHRQHRGQQQTWFRVVLEVCNVRQLPTVGIQVDVLSKDRVRVHPWQPL